MKSLRLLPMIALFAGLVIGLGACSSYVDSYEAAVHEWEPVYCYQRLGGHQCYREPVYGADKQLINYYGPHPSRYEAPEPVTKGDPKAPPMVNFFVRDPEPIPEAMPAKAPREVLPWKAQDRQPVLASGQQASAEQIQPAFPMPSVAVIEPSLSAYNPTIPAGPPIVAEPADLGDINPRSAAFWLPQ